MSKVYLGIGSNQGNREENLLKAMDILRSHCRVNLTKASSVYETSPVGHTDQPFFLNAAIEGYTELDPFELLACIKEVETIIGREKTFHWGPRIMDIDILIYGDRMIHDEILTVPHAQMLNRAFVLIPLAEIDPEFIFPDGTKITDHLKNLPEEDTVTLREDIFLTDKL